MNIAIILLAGKGSRISSEEPKQFLIVGKMPLYMHTSIIFEKNEEIDQIVLVTNKEYLDLVKQQVTEYKLNKVVAVIEGGNSREESAKNAVNYIHCDNEDIVLIHDADRPFVNDEIILNNIKGCKEHNAVITAIKETNSVSKCSNDGSMSSSLNREEIFIHQTPQTFKFGLIHEALNKTTIGTDEAGIVSSLGHKVFYVNGSAENKKITVKEDLQLLEKLIK